MVIRKRLSKPFDVIFMNDEGLMEENGLDDEQHRKYALSRNIDDVPESVRQRCTVWTCKPLTTEYEYALTSLSGAAWTIFSKHVIGVKGFDISIDAATGVKEKYREDIPIDVVNDIAAVIVGKAKVDTTPFTPPRTLSGDRIRYRSLLAVTAAKESVTK